jgi:peroxiredoxin-like protein
MKDSSAMQHEFRVTGHWQGGRAGQGETAAQHVSTMISLPQELGGSARGTNPEEMLFTTAAACYLITLGIILEKRGIATERLEVVTTGTMDDEKLKITKIVHAPKVVLMAAPSAEQKTSLAEAIHRAEQMCLISNAIRGNVEVTIVWNEASCESPR